LRHLGRFPVWAGRRAFARLAARRPLAEEGATR